MAVKTVRPGMRHGHENFCSLKASAVCHRTNANPFLLVLSIKREMIRFTVVPQAQVTLFYDFIIRHQSHMELASAGLISGRGGGGGGGGEWV